jgi:AraC family transcriptional regulator, ethanolamine operon transcriptional activator
MRIKNTRDATVRRAAALLREQACEPVRLRDVCEAIGMSERSLRDAFYRVCGMSPMRFERFQRLSDARRALQTAPPDRGAVTQVAIQFGFFELGRFAKSYKAAFGETPSQTLRGHRTDTLDNAPLTSSQPPADAA